VSFAEGNVQQPEAPIANPPPSEVVTNIPVRRGRGRPRKEDFLKVNPDDKSL
jgi:hypothetical protein